MNPNGGMNRDIGMTLIIRQCSRRCILGIARAFPQHINEPYRNPVRRHGRRGTLPFPGDRKLGPAGLPLALRPLSVHRADGDLADVDEKSIPIGPVDRDGEPDAVLVLVKSDATDLRDLHMPVCWKVEVASLYFVGSPPLYRVLVSGLLDAASCQIRDGARQDITRIQQPRSAL
jgi:hypothetical protein